MPVLDDAVPMTLLLTWVGLEGAASLLGSRRLWGLGRSTLVLGLICAGITTVGEWARPAAPAIGLQQTPVEVLPANAPEAVSLERGVRGRQPAG